MANKIVDHSQLEQYFQMLCNNHKLLNPEEAETSKHFYAWKESLVGTSIKDPALVLLPTLFGIKDEMSDNVHLTARVDFMVCVSGKKDNDALNSEKLNLSFEILWDVISQIKQHSRNNFSVEGGRYIYQFDPNTVQIDEFPPYGADYMIGYKCSFEFLNPKSLSKIPANWYT